MITGFHPDLIENAITVGLFDPGSLLINLSPDLLRSVPRSSAVEDLLEALPAAEVTHELVHLVQTLGTTAGVRDFAFRLDGLANGIRLIEHAARIRGGRLLAPLFKNLKAYSGDTSFAEVAAGLGGLMRRSMLHAGGWQVPLTSLSSADSGMSQSWLRVEPAFVFAGERLARPQLFADVSVQTGRPVATALGAVHLREGAATSIETVQRRLFNEPGPRASPQGEVRRLSDAERQRADPYYLASFLYHGAVTATQGCSDGASLEEFAVLVDTALMIDNYVWQWPALISLSDAERNNALPTVLANEMNPMDTFDSLLTALTQNWASLPRIDATWNQLAVTEFQNRLLVAAGVAATMRQLCDRTLSFATSLFDSYSDWLFPTLMTEFRNTFIRVLRWRRDNLNGGAILEDFHTDARRLRGFMMGIMPAFTLGPVVVSPRGDVRPGEGVGVDMANFQQLASVISGLILGSTGCPLAGPIRCCPLPVVALCEGRPAQTAGSSYCARDDMTRAFFESVGVREVIWTP